MNRTRAKELAPIIQAFADGKAIEWLNPKTKRWEIATSPTWADDITYHIYTEPKLVPFTYQDINILGKCVYENGYPFQRTHMIIGIDNSGVVFHNKGVSFKDLLEKYKFVDDSPCGKLIEK